MSETLFFKCSTIYAQVTLKLAVMERLLYWAIFRHSPTRYSANTFDSARGITSGVIMLPSMFGMASSSF
ncbi:MAG: hypothetical protein ACI808_002280 [Paraglaciecola sp.]|jgi:hypothetical protein